MAFYKSDSTSTDLSAVSPEATDYLDMWDKLISICDDNNDAIVTFAVASGGTSGYAIGDFLELLDGGATEAFPTGMSGCRATFEVTAVSTGVVTGIRIRNSGLYSTLPTDNGTGGEFDMTILTGSGVGTVSLDLTFSGNGWTVERRTQEVDTVAVGAAAGSGYAVSDKVDPVGGDTRTGYDTVQGTNIARFNVDSVSGGAVTGLSIDDRGVYHRTPGTNEVATVNDGSGDDVLTVDLTFRDYTGSESELETILSSGTTVIGMRTFSDDVSYFNMEIAGIPVFTAANDYDAQVGISPGRFPDDDSGSYVVMKNTTFDYWINVDDRRIIGVFLLDGGRYSNMYLGLGNPYATTAEYPLPLLVLGCSSVRDINKDTSAVQWAGMHGMLAQVAADTNGPGQVRSAGGIWHRIRNGNASGATVLLDLDEVHTTPGGWHAPNDSALADQDKIASFSPKNDWQSYASVQDSQLADTQLPTFDASSNELPILVEVIVNGIESAGSPLNSGQGIVFCEVDHICWLSQTLNVGSLSAEDEVVDGDGNLYIVFNNCRLSGRQHYFALRVA